MRNRTQATTDGDGIHRRLLRPAVIAVAISLTLAACSGDDDDADPAEADDADDTGDSAANSESDDRPTSLVMSHPQEPPNWNYWETGASALRVPTFLNVQEPLVERMADGTVEPLLAESWEISDDGLEYTFNIREALFHDGTELDAADVVYSLEVNAESPIAQMSSPLAPVESVEAIDERTVRVVLSDPSQGFLQGLGRNAGIIVPEGMHEDYNLEQEVIGTGPYVFGEYRPDVDLALARFDEYWGELPYFETVTHRFIPDETAALNALEAGDIDMVGAILGEGIDRVESFEPMDEFAVGLPVIGSQAYVFMNTQAEVFEDERVRQAVAHAIDRESHLIAAVSGYGDTNCVHAVPASEPYNTDYCPYQYDPERSKELLAEAGYEDGLTIEYKYLTIAEFPPIMEVLVSQLAEVGITLDPVGLDLATWLEEVNTEGLYEMSTITAGATLPDFVSAGGRQPGLVDDTFDSLIAQADAAIEFDEWVDLSTQATNRLADLAWTIPLFNKTSPTISRSDLIGFKDYRTAMEMDLRNLRWAD